MKVILFWQGIDSKLLVWNNGIDSKAAMIIYFSLLKYQGHWKFLIYSRHTRLKSSFFHDLFVLSKLTAARNNLATASSSISSGD
ncbi:MAG: hypothetical protein IPO69_22045 [Saprospiraceae bacterium]|nr:hypothetical protein [Saprospiraceae bacterium]